MIVGPHPPPPVLEGFAHIERSWDPREGCYVARLQPGEYFVSHGGEMALTILGSCVSACIRDPRTGLAGMNHFMLPVGAEGAADHWNRLDRTSASTRYGNFAMERLINEFLSRGARRSDLEVKVVGGGRMWSASSDVGGQNARFVMEYLAAERLHVLASDLGDDFPRRVHYHLDSGLLRVRKIRRTDFEDVRRTEERYLNRLAAQPVAGDAELF